MGFELFIDLRIKILLHYPKLRKLYLATFSNTEREREREREDGIDGATCESPQALLSCFGINVGPVLRLNIPLTTEKDVKLLPVRVLASKRSLCNYTSNLMLATC